MSPPGLTAIAVRAREFAVAFAFFAISRDGKRAGGIELLDPIVGRVRNVYRSPETGSVAMPVRRFELAVAGAFAAKLGYVLARERELLHAIVARIDDVGVFARERDAIGALNWLLPDPSAPNDPMYSPVSENSSTRSLPVSLTQTSPVVDDVIAPAGTIATPSGALSCPGSLPFLPNERTYSPSELSSSMRLLPLSATYTSPNDGLDRWC